MKIGNELCHNVHGSRRQEKLPNLPCISIFSHAKHPHHFLPVNGRYLSETTSLLQHLFCHPNDYYSSPLYHHLLISCKATSIASLSLAIRYVTRYWQPAATRSFWAAYHFWQLGQLTSAVVPTLPCHQEKRNFQGVFLFFEYWTIWTTILTANSGNIT